MEVGLWLPSRRDLLRVLLLILPLLSPSSAPAQTLTANVEVNGFSFSLGPAATGRFTAFFTTFDGSRGIPLQDCLGGFCTISSEFSPVVNGSTSYRADYIAQSAPGVTLEYGTVAVALSASDSDQDGLLDVLERLSPGNFSLNGTTTPHVNYEVDLLIDEFGAFFVSSLSVTVVRGTSLREGTYSGTFSGVLQSGTLAGKFFLSGASGEVSYTLGGPNLAWKLNHQTLDGSTRLFTGISELKRLGTSAIEIPSFAVSDSRSGLSMLTRTAVLTRSGNVFRGQMDLVDGKLETSWPDYTAFQVEIVDLNDTDFDGLPDLVAVPEPHLALQWLVALATVFVRMVRARSTEAAGPTHRRVP